MIDQDKKWQFNLVLSFAFSLTVVCIFTMAMEKFKGRNLFKIVFLMNILAAIIYFGALGDSLSIIVSLTLNAVLQYLIYFIDRSRTANVGRRYSTDESSETSL